MSQYAKLDRTAGRLRSRVGLVFLGLSLALLLVWTAPSASAQMASGGRIFAVTTSDNLVSFTKANPGEIRSNVPITGMRPDETMVGIDHRPATGTLYGIGSTSQVYTINRSTGVATPVGAPFTPALVGTAFGVDFNPTVDRIRVVSNQDQNLRLNPNTGATAATDLPLQYAAADPNAGTDPNVVAAAYGNNMAGATTTTLYDIDSGLDVLTTQNPPNNGTLNTIGRLGLNTTALAGFDIAPGYGALAALTPMGTRSTLYAVDLGTGDVRNLGRIGTRMNVRDIAIPLPMP